DFDGGVRNLASCIDGRTAKRPTIPTTTGRFGLPRKVPFSVRLVATTLMLIGLYCFNFVLSNLWKMATLGQEFWEMRANLTELGSPETLTSRGEAVEMMTLVAMLYIGVTLIALIVGLWYLRTARRFLQRNLRYVTGRRALLAQLPIGVVTVFYAWLSTEMFSTYQFYDFNGAWAGGTTIAAALFFVFALIAFLLMGHATALYRWLPTGEAPLKRRARHGRRLGKTLAASAEMTQGAAVRYALHFAPPDETIASRVKREMAQAGHTLADDGETAEQAIVLLSNMTPVAMVQPLIDAGQPFLPLLITGVDIAEESPIIGHYQWVDFRRQATEQLQRMAHYLRNQAAGMAEYGLSAMPERFDKHIVPGRIAFLATVLRLLAVLIIVYELNELAQHLELLPTIVLAMPYPVPNTAMTLIVLGYIGGGIVLVLLANLLLLRKISSRWFLLVLFAVMLMELVGISFVRIGPDARLLTYLFLGLLLILFSLR
ncbi:MAG: hypothetical protein KDE31_00730, partial [Caldilineaceae bacterium]|nr:hypothetical protein [Caldilineaceae bacterium]